MALNVPALLLIVLLQDAAAQEPLKEEIARLQKENAALQLEIDQLQKFGVDAAQELARLRARIQELEAKLAGAPPVPSPEPSAEATPAPTASPSAGPAKVLTGKVMATDARFNFVIIGIGEADGVQPGYRFEIVRRDKDGSLKRIAVADFEKYVGESKAQSKLKVVEGNTGDVRYEDEAVAFRKGEAPKLPTDSPAPSPAPTPGAKKFRITGQSKETYFLDYGSLHGARQSDLVFIYRDHKLRAKLRIEVVDKEWSTAKIVDGTKTAEISEEDEITLKEEKSRPIGRVKFNDSRRGVIIDIGIDTHGAKVGLKFEVRRNGRKVGEVAIIKTDRFISYVEPLGTTKPEDILVDDIVEGME